jgi:tRNA nucleotidyltransferase/poly(A) polymerase
MLSQLQDVKLLQRIRGCTDPEDKIYLVGGAIRDVLLGKPGHDLDFIVVGNTQRIAKKVARVLSGKSFILDDKRQTVRVIYGQQNQPKFTLDFNALQGKNIQADLRNRDFTINSIAVDLNSLDIWIDPLHGITDLKNKKLVLCGPDSLKDDPVRILRAFRFASEHFLQFTKPLKIAITKTVSLVKTTSRERQRDELFQILSIQNSIAAIQELEQYGVLGELFPEFVQMKGIQLPDAASIDLWAHTINVFNKSEALLEVLIGPPEFERVIDPSLANIIEGLSGFKEQIQKHFSNSIQVKRNRKSLFLFAVLCHDIGAPNSAFMDWDAQIHFYGHEVEGAKQIVRIAKRFALSNDEIEYLQKFISNHSQVDHLSNFPSEALDRFVFRYFKQTGDVGIDLCLFSLVDLISRNDQVVSQEQIDSRLKVVAYVLDTYWIRKMMNQKMIMGGEQIMRVLHIRPGAVVGKALEILQKEQAIGNIITLQDAEKFIKNWFGKTKHDPLM